MAKKFYLNQNAQSNGDHEVHTEDCYRLPLVQNRIYLGLFDNCQQAIRKAKEYYSQIDGCYYCCNACHKQ